MISNLSILLFINSLILSLCAMQDPNNPNPAFDHIPHNSQSQQYRSHQKVLLCSEITQHDFYTCPLQNCAITALYPDAFDHFFSHISILCQFCTKSVSLSLIHHHLTTKHSDNDVITKELFDWLTIIKCNAIYNIYLIGYCISNTIKPEYKESFLNHCHVKLDTEHFYKANLLKPYFIIDNQTDGPLPQKNLHRILQLPQRPHLTINVDQPTSIQATLTDHQVPDQDNDSSDLDE